MQILCNLSLEFIELKRRYKIDFFEYFAKEQEFLHQLQNDGLIALDANQLIVTPRGRPFLRNICMAFDRYLQPDSHRHSHAL
jgi:oxygen-independent coproporphyrinogen-3 oxidase